MAEERDRLMAAAIAKADFEVAKAAAGPAVQQAAPTQTKTKTTTVTGAGTSSAAASGSQFGAYPQWGSPDRGAWPPQPPKPPGGGKPPDRPPKIKVEPEGDGGGPPGDEPPDDDGDDDEDGGPDDYARRIRRALRDIREGRNAREADVIKIGTLPNAQQFSAWRLLVRDEVAAASGKGQLAFTWVMETELPGATYDTLADSGNFVNLDVKLLQP